MRLVSTCRRRKSTSLSRSRRGMALWLGAKIETMYVPKSPRWTAMKSSACKGSSTENSRAEVQREVCADHQGFDQRALRLLRGEELDAAAEHADRLQEREREDQGGLVFHDEPREPSLVESLLFFEGEQRDVHVGVYVHLVRVAVMLVVLVDPPLAAHAEQQVAEDEGEPVVLPGGAEGELPVPEVVG